MRLQNAHIIITGGASGLGLATGQYLASLGAKITLFDLKADDVAEKAAALSSLGYAIDVAEPDLASIFDDAISKNGALRGVVSCAGIADAGRIVGRNGALGLSAFERVIRVNLIGTFNIMRLAAERMSQTEPDKDGTRGCIVNTSSIAATDGQIGQAAYAASKAGVQGLTLPAARELANFGIRVNTIAPGLFRTPLLDGVPQETIDSIEAMIPYPGRLGDPMEFAKTVAFCFENDYINGENIRVDGAARLPPK